MTLVGNLIVFRFGRGNGVGPKYSGRFFPVIKVEQSAQATAFLDGAIDLAYPVFSLWKRDLICQALMVAFVMKVRNIRIKGIPKGFFLQTG